MPHYFEQTRRLVEPIFRCDLLHNEEATNYYYSESENIAIKYCDNCDWLASHKSKIKSKKAVKVSKENYLKFINAKYVILK